MILIELTKGYLAKVDDEDYDRLSQISWQANDSAKERVYAQARVDKRTVRMQRLVMNAPVGVQVDHINGDTLDNRKSNLRLCTRSQNGANRRTTKGTSKYKGVTRDRRRAGNQWHARATRDQELRNLGS